MSKCKCGCGQEVTKECNRYILGHNNRGKNHHLYGKHHSKETKRKISESHIGKHHSEDTKKKLSENHKGMKGKKHSEETLRKMSGENNYNWQGGISFEPYCSKFNHELKEKIRDEYDRKCVLCGKDEKDNITKSDKVRKLDIHHIDLDKEQGCNRKQWKLIPLCMSCHSELHGRRKLMEEK